MQRFLSGQRMTEAGPLGLISEDEEDEETGADIKLPGVRRGEGRRETVCVWGGGGVEEEG